MPKITSTITRKQQEAENVPQLPKPIDDMTPDEIEAHYGGIRDNRIQASQKRKAVRAVNKSKKQDAALEASTSPGAKVAAATDKRIKELKGKDANFSFDDDADDVPASGAGEGLNGEATADDDKLSDRDAAGDKRTE